MSESMERGPFNLLVIFILVVKVKGWKLKLISFFGAFKRALPRRMGDL